MSKKIGLSMLLIAAAISIFTAFAHSTCIFLGPECYSYQMAPKSLITSAEQGTLLAPIATILISLVFLVWAAYALSAAQLIPRLPFQPFVVYAIAIVCLIRGILGVQLWLRRPELVTDFGNISNWFWLLTGLLFLLGYRALKPVNTRQRAN